MAGKNFICQIEEDLDDEDDLLDFEDIHDDEGVTKDEKELSIEENINLIKLSLDSGWCCIEKEEIVKFAKLEDFEAFPNPQVSFLLTIQKDTKNVLLHRYQELLDVKGFAPLDLDQETGNLKCQKSHIESFISILNNLSSKNTSLRDVLKVSIGMIEHAVRKIEDQDVDAPDTMEKHLVALHFIVEQLKIISGSNLKYSPAIIK